MSSQYEVSIQCTTNLEAIQLAQRIINAGILEGEQTAEVCVNVDFCD